MAESVTRRWITSAHLRDLIEGPPPKILTVDDFDPWQKWMANKVIQRLGVILAAEMGLGKTAATLYGMIKLLEAGKIKKWLVVAPLRVAEETWPDEMWKWDFAREYQFSPILGSEKDRIAAVKSDAPIHIINRENITWLWKKYRHNWPYDGLIYDESSRLKAGERRSATKKDKETGRISGGVINEFGSLAQAVDAKKFKRVVELTGTPTPNGLQNWWGQMYLVDGGDRLGNDKVAFDRRWFYKNEYTRKVEAQDHAEEEIMARIKDAVFSLKEQDFLTSKLPPVVPHPRWVTLPEKAMAEYKMLQKEMVLDEYDVEAVNNGVLANKLLQLCNGSIYDSEGHAHEIHSRKLEELESIHHGAGGRPVLVAYSYKFDLDRILGRFPKWRVFGESDKDMADWNAGKIDGLLIHPQSAGHGLNFQFGGNILIWYGLTWSLEYFLQTNKRIHRRGQQADRVHQYFILAKNTFDERQYSVLSEKEQTQERITDQIRVLRSTVEAQV
jgi:SNF2 family DNA or RNA helicase